MPNTKGLTINGRPVSDDEYKQYWTQVFRNDPEMQRIFQQVSGSGNAGRIGSAQATVQQLQPAHDALVQKARSGQPFTPAEIAQEQQYNQAIYTATRGGSEQGKEFAFDQRARELGWETPGEGWSLDFDESGPRVEREGYLQRNKQWLIPAAVGAAGGIGAAQAGVFSGAGATAPASTGIPAGSTTVGSVGFGAPGAFSAGAVPATGTSLGTAGFGFGAGGVPVASTLGGTTMAAAAPAAGGIGTAAGIVGPVISSKDFWGKLALGIGGDLFNGYIANRSANKAADELNKAGDKQIAAYDKALGPYMDPAPLNALKFLSGLPAGGGQAPSATPMATPFDTNRLDNATTGRTAPAGAQFSPGMAVPRQGTLSSLVPQAQRQQAQQQTASSFVRMVSPDGEEGDVHPSQVQNAINAGARPLAMGRG